MLLIAFFVFFVSKMWMNVSLGHVDTLDTHVQIHLDPLIVNAVQVSILLMMHLGKISAKVTSL